MGEASSAASAASTAGTIGETASTAGNVAGTASGAMDAFNAGSNAMSTGGYLDSALSAGGGQTAGVGSIPSGYSLEPMSSTNVPMTPAQSASLDKWGTADPSLWQQGYDTYQDFSKGMNSDFPSAYRDMMDNGFNAKTAGYAFGKVNDLSKMAGGGGGGGGGGTTFNTYVSSSVPQKDEEYRRRYRRY